METTIIIPKKRAKQSPEFLKPDFDKKITRGKRRRIAERKIMRADARMVNAIHKVRALTDKQREAIDLMTEYTEPYTDQQMANALGVNRKTIGRWLHDPFFLDELDKAITIRKNYSRRWAWKHMHRMVRQGKYRAIKDYMKLVGDEVDRHEISDKRDDISQLPEVELDDQIKSLQRELGIRVETITPPGRLAKSLK